MSSKEQFIQNLSAQLQPVKRLASPEKRTLFWSSITLVVITAVLSYLGSYREGASSLIGFNQFTFETIASLLSLFVTSYVVFKMNIPGISVSSMEKALAFAPISFFAGFLLYGMYVEPSVAPTMVGKRPHCVFEVLALSVPPLFFLLYQLSKGHSRYSGAQFLMMGLAASSVPMTVMQVACMYDPTHNLKYHLGPGLVVSVLFTVVAVAFVKIRRAMV